ncbi:MAG: hypothetical protein ABJ275_10245 [Maricaulaceae bacterium]
MQKPIKCILLTALYFGPCGCAVQAAEKISSNEYYQHLEKIEQSFIDDDFDKLSAGLVYLGSIKSTEVPNYESYFFEAVRDLESGNVLEGQNKLKMFKVMLLVDSGHINCIDLEDVQSLDIVYSKMCAEYFYSYYQNPSAKSQEKILLYWYLIHIAKQRYQLL